MWIDLCFSFVAFHGFVTSNGTHHVKIICSAVQWINMHTKDLQSVMFSFSVYSHIFTGFSSIMTDVQIYSMEEHRGGSKGGTQTLEDCFWEAWACLCSSSTHLKVWFIFVNSIFSLIKCNRYCITTEMLMLTSFLTIIFWI